MKKRTIGIIATAVLIGWVFNIFPGRFLAAKISTWPLLNRWKILSPQAPIVITNRETVRVEGGEDVAQAAGQIKAKLSSVVEVKGSAVTPVGNAINLTSDGSFVASPGSFNDKAGEYFVILNDGRQAPIVKRVSDPATSLIFFKADLESVPTASLGSSKNIQAGAKLVFVQNSLRSFSQIISSGWASFGQNEIEGKVTQSDYPRRGFVVDLSGPAMANGEVIINTDGEIVGLFNGSEIISSDVLKQATGLYLNNQTEVIRPQFGFSYSLVTKTDSKLTGLSEGAQVKEVGLNSPARQAGLVAGDIITTVQGQEVNENSSLEEILQAFKPGDKIALSILRKNQNINLDITVGELK